MSVYAPEDVFEASPADAPAFVPSPVAEDAIHAFAGDPLSEVMRLILVESSRGEGKFLKYDELVLTPTGWVKAVDLRPGDAVLAGDGAVTSILGRYPQPISPLWRLRFSDGTFLDTSDDHLWAVETAWDRHGHPRLRKLRAQVNPTRPARHIGQGFKICTTKLIRERLASGAWDQGGRWSLPLVGPVQFPVQPVLLPPYLLGVLLGDGGLSDWSVMLSTTDEEILDRVRALLPNAVHLTHSDRCTYRLTGFGRGSSSCNPVLEALRAYGIQGCRSHEKFVPTPYLWNDPATRLAVLQGLLDTDGTVLRHSNSVSLTTTSERLREDTLFLVRSLGGVAKARQVVKRYRYLGELRSGRSAWHIVISLPPEMPPFRLARKAAIVRPKQPRGKPRRFIVGAEPAGESAGVCFRVAHTSGLFVVKDFLVTHNTSCGVIAHLVLADTLIRAGLAARLPYITAVVRDTHVNLQRTTIPTFRELQRMGLPLRIVGQGDEAIIEQDGLETNRFVFFGLDRPADADRLQGFTCGSLWIEEAAPAADFSGGVAPEALGIGATSVRQPDVPPRILLTQNPADDDHWTVHLEETLLALGLADIEFLKFWMPPGGKAAHFRELAALATDPAERDRWLKSADAFDAYRRRSQALLEATGRQDLVQRLIKGEKGAVKMGEPVVPEFSRALHVPKTPVRALPGLPLFRWWDLGGVHPAVAWCQTLAANGGVNVLGSRVGVNVGMADFILSEVRPFEAQYGLQARREGDPFKRGWRGTYVVRDITDPTGNGVDARRIIQEMLKTRCEVGPERWAARRQALQTAFIRKGIGDRMWMQLDGQENKLLIQALGGRCHYRIDPVTGRIDGSLESMKRASGIFCVDSETEILTERGFQSHGDLQKGETLYGFDLRLGRLVRTSLLDVHRFEGPFTALRFHSNSLDMVVTPDHRCVVRRRLHRGTRLRYGPIELRPAAELNSADSLIRTAALRQTALLSDGLVRLCGWIVAEGSYYGRGCVRISQSKSANSAYCQAIEALLAQFPGAWFRTHISPRKTPYGMGVEQRWSITGDLAATIQLLLPDKRPGLEFARRISAHQAQLFIYELARGDGSWNRVKGPLPDPPSRFRPDLSDFFHHSTIQCWPGDEATVDAVQHIACLGGLGARRIRATRGLPGLAFSHHRHKAAICQLEKETIQISDAWCPETPTGTWVARRHGFVFVTGNSHPVDCLGYGLGKLFPAHQWLRRALETRAPRAEAAQPARSWLGH